jgi:hypothetical protein
MIHSSGPEAAKEMRLLMGTSIKDSAEIAPHLLDFVQFYSKHDVAVAVVDINRRFGKRIRAMSDLTLLEHLLPFVENGQIGMVKRSRKVWLYDRALLLKYIEDEKKYTAPGEYFDPEAGQERLISSWITRAEDMDKRTLV